MFIYFSKYFFGIYIWHHCLIWLQKKIIITSERACVFYFWKCSNWKLMRRVHMCECVFLLMRCWSTPRRHYIHEFFLLVRDKTSTDTYKLKLFLSTLNIYVWCVYLRSLISLLAMWYSARRLCGCETTAPLKKCLNSIGILFWSHTWKCGARGLYCIEQADYTKWTACIFLAYT